jgi:hypothetical protein
VKALKLLVEYWLKISKAPEIRRLPTERKERAAE